MDFTLALTHFCEAHGPKSVLCTQVLPLECALCLPPSPPLRAQQSSDSLTTEVPLDSSFDQRHFHTPPRLRKTDTNLTLPTDFSSSTTNVESDPDSPTIEKHPLFRADDPKREIAPQYRYGRSQGETCASCSFSVPQRITDKLPPGAPGSTKSDGKSNGAPVLRSRQFVCLGERRRKKSQDSRLSTSSGSPASSHPDDCHDHTLTYLTAKSPDDPASYAQLRASVIRTLSCELLPRGVSDGPFCFGNSDSGYTIAYVFRLTDPKARGRRRAYAFVALAGKDAGRALQACLYLWEVFAAMAKNIEQRAQRHQEAQRQLEEQSRQAAEKKSRNYTPVSSFLVSRAVDPDGLPRRSGQAAPRSLSEIVGDENIFTYLHQSFVGLLKKLGDQFGGLPLADRLSVYASMGDGDRYPKTTTVAVADMAQERSNKEPQKASSSTSEGGLMRSRRKKSIPNNVQDELELAKVRANKAFKLNPVCTPLAVMETAQRQVVV